MVIISKFQFTIYFGDAQQSVSLDEIDAQIPGYFVVGEVDNDCA